MVCGPSCPSGPPPRVSPAPRRPVLVRVAPGRSPARGPAAAGRCVGGTVGARSGLRRRQLGNRRGSGPPPLPERVLVPRPGRGIGGGVVGCAVAWRLSSTAARVTLVAAAHDLGAGASKGSTGLANSGGDGPPGTPTAGERARRGPARGARAARQGADPGGGLRSREEFEDLATFDSAHLMWVCRIYADRGICLISAPRDSRGIKGVLRLGRATCSRTGIWIPRRTLENL